MRRMGKKVRRLRNMMRFGAYGLFLHVWQVHCLALFVSHAAYASRKLELLQARVNPTKSMAQRERVRVHRKEIFRYYASLDGQRNTTSLRVQTRGLPAPKTT